LQINERQLQRVMAEADENDYGMIVYHPDSSSIIETAARVIFEIHHTAPLPDLLSTAPSDVILGRHLLRDDFDRMLVEGFQQSDEFKSGTLTRAELRRALDICAVGFKPGEVNILLSVAEEDKNAMVNYVSLTHRCFDIIRNYCTDNLNVHRLLEKEVESRMLEGFRAHDKEDAKSLHCVEIRDILCLSQLGLTRLQVFDLCSEVAEDDGGFIAYEDFAKKAAERVVEQFVPEIAVAHAKYMRTHAAVDVGEQAITGALRLAFGTSADFMRNDVLKILRADTALRLSAREINGLMSMVDEDEEGFAVCTQLVDLGYDVLKFMAFQDHLRGKEWSTPPFREITSGIATQPH